MTRASTKAVRRTAGDLSDTMAPHLSHARDVMVDTVLPRAKDTMDTVLPKAKATGVGLAIKAGLAEAPKQKKQRHPFRKAALLGVIAAGAYAAWKSLRSTEDTDDWTSPEAAPRTDPAPSTA